MILEICFAPEVQVTPFRVMSFDNCGNCLEKLPADSKTLPTCSACECSFHYGGCSGNSEFTWKKKGPTNQGNWVCHFCKPNKRMPRSNTGIAILTQRNLIDNTVTAVEQLTPTDADPASKKRCWDDVTSPTQDTPTFPDLDSKCSFILDEVMKLSRKTSKVLEQLQEVKSDLAAVQVKAAADSARIDRLEEMSKIHSQHISELKNKNAELETKNAELELKNRALEDYSRADNILVHGVPPMNDELNATDIVLTIAKAAKVNLSDLDLNACHYLKSAPGSSPRIICKLVNRWLKYKLLAAVNKAKFTTTDLQLPGEKQSIFLTEHLSPESSKILGEAKRTLWTRSGGTYEYVGVRNRRIYARVRKGDPSIEIRTSSQLQNLINLQSNRSQAMEVVQLTQ